MIIMYYYTDKSDKSANWPCLKRFQSLPPGPVIMEALRRTRIVHHRLLFYAAFRNCRSLLLLKVSSLKNIVFL